MAHLPPKAPPNMTQNWQYSLPSQMMHITSNTTTAVTPPWVDEFLDFSSVRRNAYRRSETDSTEFLPLLEECPTSPPPPPPRSTTGGFERFDDEQLMSMFSDEMAVVRVGPTVSSSNPSTPSDHNSNDEEKPRPPQDLHQKIKKLKEEQVDDGSCKSDPPINYKPSNNAGGGDTVVDPRRVKRILANRQSAQRSRVRKLQYISELERCVTTLQSEVSALSPRVAFFDHQRLILNVDNSTLKQRIAALIQDKIFNDVSGLSGTTETAQSQVSVGMGLLAGSTVLTLTILWGTCVIVGKCDIQDSIAVDGKDTKGLSLTGSGVSTDIWTCYAARIMVVSVIPFIVVQLPQAMASTSGRHLAVLIGLIFSLTMLLSYCLYQVFQPWIQTRRIAFAKHKHVISGILRHLKQRALGRLLRDDGTPDQDVIAKLFQVIDADGDGHISSAELKALIIGIEVDEIYLDEAEATEKVMKEFDTSSDGKIDKHEFIAGISRWLDETRHSGASSNAGPNTVKYLDDFHEVGWGAGGLW